LGLIPYFLQQQNIKQKPEKTLEEAPEEIVAEPNSTPMYEVEPPNDVQEDEIQEEEQEPAQVLEEKPDITRVIKPLPEKEKENIEYSISSI